MSRGDGSRRRTPRAGLATLAVLLLVAGACSSDEGATPASGSTADGGGAVEVSATPEGTGLADLVAISVTGLGPDSDAVLRVTSTDARDVDWSSSTSYRADGDGTIDLASHPGPDGGDPDPMAPISSLRPVDPDAQALAYFWSGDLQPFTVSVLVDDEEVATTEVRRGAPTGVLADTATIAADGFVGQLWTPPDGVEVQAPAIVSFGGSGGGYTGTLVGPALAAEGHPVLDVAYFNGDFLDDPGLPEGLADIPLEYLTGAITWLGRQPGVDPDQVWVMGASRGSEAALLLGADVPELVAGVVALVPSNVARCGYPDCSRPAWTLDGSPVPFTTQRNEPAPTDTPGAVIPVEQIDGPVLAVCGEADEVWDSCAFSDAIEARLDEADHPFPHQVIAEPDAGHAVGALVPYQPRAGGGDPDLIGTSEAADQAALGRVWPRVLAFLTEGGGP